MTTWYSDSCACILEFDDKKIITEIHAQCNLHNDKIGDPLMQTYAALDNLAVAKNYPVKADGTGLDANLEAKAQMYTDSITTEDSIG